MDIITIMNEIEDPEKAWFSTSGLELDAVDPSEEGLDHPVKIIFPVHETLKNETILLESFRWKGNFGDELNRLIWPCYFRGFLDEDFSKIFIGIGTLLNTGVKSSATNIVMGTGTGYGSLSDMSNSHWKIYCLGEYKLV